MNGRGETTDSSVAHSIQPRGCRNDGVGGGQERFFGGK